MRLARVNFFACRLFVVIIEHLQLAHARVSRVALAGVTDGQAVVAARRQLEFQPGHEIGILISGINRAAFLRTALDGAVHHLIFSGRPRPALEIPAIEDGFEPFGAVAGQNPVGIVGTDLTEEKVAPADFAAVSLELDRSFGRDRRLAVVIIFKQGVIYNQLVIEPDADSRANHNDADRVPLAEGLVGQDQRVFARRTRTVIPQAARAFVGAQGELRLLRGIPNLDLRTTAQIYAGVGSRDSLIFYQQFKIAVIFLGAGVGALAVIDQLAGLNPPVRFHGFGPLRNL